MKQNNNKANYQTVYDFVMQHDNLLNICLYKYKLKQLQISIKEYKQKYEIKKDR